jgi:hypothetical protein
MIALGHALEEVFSNMQAQILLDLTSKVGVIDAKGLSLVAQVERRQGDSYLVAKVRTETYDDLCSFSIGTRIDLGKVMLRLDVSSTFCDSFFAADIRFNALKALMEVARMVDKTYLQTWVFEA